MPLKNFTLTKKLSLTKNVFEMTFQSSESFDFIAGQFITFILPEFGGRAYSVLKTHGNNIVLIIKKRELNDGGRGGSKYICNREIGEILTGVGPAGRFILQNTNNNKLFLGTGTGFVPLYNQIIHSLHDKQDCTLTLIFGVRTLADLFYIKQLKILQQQHSNFTFKIYLSREKTPNYQYGYITDYLTSCEYSHYGEYYICGTSAMIDSSIEILKSNKILEENIFTEKY